VQPHVVLTQVVIDEPCGVEDEVAGAGDDLAEPVEEVCLVATLDHLVKIT